MKNLKRIISSFIAASMVYTSVFANFVYAADTNEDKMYIGAFIDKNSNYTIDKEQIGSTVNIDFDVINNNFVFSLEKYILLCIYFHK